MEPPPFINDLKEANTRFDRLELIGEGTYGEVYRGVNKLKNEIAIKVVSNLPNKYDEIQNEMAIFQKFSRHPNMVDYYGTYIYRNENGLPIQIWLVMEYCGGRSVSQLAKTTVYNGGKLSENVIKYILKETLSALNYLHQNCIIHRDIKGPNILLTISGHVKLIDFGVSARLESTADRKHSSVGSPFWMAPEVIACEQQLDYSYDNRCDIWSLGITAIELADADPPLADEHPMRALFKIPRNPPPTVKVPKKWSDAFLNFIARAVTKDFEIRPTANTLMKDPFFEGVASEETSIRKELMSIIHIINKRFSPVISAGGDQTLLNRQENAKRNLRVLEADDLAKLPRLTDHSILNYLSERYDADQIYTYIGEILIAINPFKDLQIYTEGATLLYKDVQKESLPPHIFMVACTTHQAMIHKRRDQCCVISGESGSGKTVSANYLVTQLAAIGKSNGDEGVNINLVKKILQLNPLMEAFGNAQTVINQNSSRFGKFLELHFTDGGTLVGAKLSEYLLEKSRVVSQPRNERNFHILYYLIAGLDFHKKLQDFELNTSGRHRYLNTDELSLAVCACTSEMQVKFTRIQKCFEDLGFTRDEIQSIYCVLASIIHLGDVDFIVDDADSFEGEKAKVLNTQKLEIVSSLLCVESDALNEALTTHCSVTRGETITHNNDVAQALDCRDATSKALYGRLFSWIVHKINSLLRAEDTSETLNRKIGILDIFGFENFSHNSFEQLCINIANEQMQFYYNEYVFVWELEEYAADGVKGINIEFKNNKPILDLFLQKPVGILALLDEESRFPKASDLTLVEKFQDNIQSEFMKTSQETSTFFTINHYAGKVVYDATGFLEKNRDTLSIDILQLLRLSTDKTIATLFQSGQKTGTTSTEKLGVPVFEETKNSADSRFSSLATSRFQQTVAIHFRQSLRVLLSKVIRADPHFVRCIRPNTQNKPNLLDQDYVMTQLRYTGVIETTKIRKQGYSDRIPFKDFVNRYKFFLYYENEEPPETSEVCVALLRKANVDEEESWKIGRTKVFLKYWHVEALSKCKERYRSKIITIRKFMRNLFIKLQVRKARVRRNAAATKIRSLWLRYIHRKRYLELIHGTKNKDNEDMIKKMKGKDGDELEHSKSTEQKAGYEVEKYKTESERKVSRETYVSDEESASLLTVQEGSDTGEATNISTVINRPHFRNMKRLIQGYDEENWSSDNGSDSPRELNSNYDVNGSCDNATDREGQAALEETRSIILLSQIDLASKETYELLNRTSYPVILSMTSKSKESNTHKTKNQKLNHKDRMIAVVDGYGDPLKQKYRQARLHYAEAVDSEENDTKALQNPPMLGLVEKPPPKYIPMDSDSDRESRKSSRRGSSSGQKGNEWFGRKGGANFSSSTVINKVSTNKTRFNQNSNQNRNTTKGYVNNSVVKEKSYPSNRSDQGNRSSYASNFSDIRKSCRQFNAIDLPGKLVPNNIYIPGQTYEERSRKFLLNTTPPKTSPPRDFFIKSSFTSGTADSMNNFRNSNNIPKPSQIVSSEFAINSYDDTADKRLSSGPVVPPKPKKMFKTKFEQLNPPTITQQNNFNSANIISHGKCAQIDQTNNDRKFTKKKKFNQSETIMHEKHSIKKELDQTELLRYERLSPKPEQVTETELFRYDRWSPKKESFNQHLSVKTENRNQIESHIQNELYKNDTLTSSDIEKKSSHIYPSSLHQKVLQERQLIEARIREVQQRRKAEQKQQSRMTNFSHGPVKFEMPYTPVPKFEQHKAFNYLMNDRTLPHKITSHISQGRNDGNKNNNNSNRNGYPNKSPPPTNKPNKYSNEQKKTTGTFVKKKNTVTDSSSKLENRSDLFNIDSNSVVVQFKNNDKEVRTHDNRKGVKKKKKGFNYGFDQEDVLRSIKLNKTGRLQELLVK